MMFFSVKYVYYIHIEINTNHVFQALKNHRFYIAMELLVKTKKVIGKFVI